ncbi:MAG: purine-nucleoside phosphorylase [Arcobacter sp.]|nr:purine-nucleoside phosphorylase [Arcobacter sp.]
MTPHIEAKKDDIADIVLMPGDPLRAKFIAENFLENVKQVNGVRNMLMFTGEYKGKRISVCGSGMGVPSIGIYSYELYKFYDVDTIIRVGSAGAYSSDLKVYDVVLATESYSDSTAFPKLVLNEDTHVTYSSNSINDKLRAAANSLDIKLHEARIHSSDVFYSARPLDETIKVTQAKCVEMESTGLFTNAKATGKNAACILSISDHLITGELTSAQQRQTTFSDMINIALESVL